MWSNFKPSCFVGPQICKNLAKCALGVKTHAGLHAQQLLQQPNVNGHWNG